MNDSEILIKFQNFIKNQKIASVATIDSKGKPWIFNIFYIIKPNLSIYFLSSSTAKHCECFEKKDAVAVSIYSHESEHGSTKGIQGDGKVSVVTKDSEVKELYDLYDVQFRNSLEEESTYKDFVKKSSKSKFYRIDLHKVYFRDSENFEGMEEISLI